MLADTAFLIDLLCDDPGAVQKLDELVELGEPLWVPAIALHELYYGARLHENHTREVRRIRELERALPPVAFTAEAARLSGQLEGEMEREGKRPGRADIQIGGLALARGDGIVTRDTRFEDIDGLRIQSY